MTATSCWAGICPGCKTPIAISAWPAAAASCSGCGMEFLANHGIACVMPQSRVDRFRTFLDEYTQIRHAEGRGSVEAAYYLRLPETRKDDPLAWQWRIRAKSMRYLYDCFFTPGLPAMKIVDLGAGVGWLSHRMANLGHKPIAIDLSVDASDGLGASSHYGGVWPRIQAEFDNLPLAGGQADIIIYNASFHYSGNYHQTLEEGLRVLGKNGKIIIMDTPVYTHAESGEQMKEDRHDQFEKRFGNRSDSLDSIEYLTWDMLEELAASLDLVWRYVMPWYGWRWFTRPYLARIRGRREPSKFALLIANRKRT